MANRERSPHHRPSMSIQLTVSSTSATYFGSKRNAPIQKSTLVQGGSTAPALEGRDFGSMTVEELRAQGKKAVSRGDLNRADSLFDAAVCRATETNDPDRDRLLCNLAAVRTELGTVGDLLPELRNILLRSQSGDVNCLAAYHLARNFELKKAFKKAMFYAQMSRDRADEAENPDFRASALNLLGNILLAESHEEAAIEAYEEALTVMPEGDEVGRARILDNVGYCRALAGRPFEAFPFLHESLRILRRNKAERWLVSTHLDLCFAHLEVSRLSWARRHGEIALKLATRTGSDDDHRNALYLLGEVATLSGDEFACHEYFGLLQDRFYPEADRASTIELLIAVGVRELVNLRA